MANAARALKLGDFGDFGVSFVATVAGRYTGGVAPVFPFRENPYLC